MFDIRNFWSTDVMNFWCNDLIFRTESHLYLKLKFELLSCCRIYGIDVDVDDQDESYIIHYKEKIQINNNNIDDSFNTMMMHWIAIRYSLKYIFI